MRRLAKLLPLLLFTAAAAGQQGCSRPREREDTAAPVPRVPAVVAAAPALDVVAMVGHNIDEVRQRLGPPVELSQAVRDPIGIRTVDSTLAFRHQGLTVLASYDAGSRRVLDLLVLGPNEDGLMRRTGLVEGAPSYLLLPVFAFNRSTRFVGLRVVPRS